MKIRVSFRLFTVLWFFTLNTYIFVMPYWVPRDSKKALTLKSSFLFRAKLKIVSHLDFVSSPHSISESSSCTSFPTSYCRSFTSLVDSDTFLTTVFGLFFWTPRSISISSFEYYLFIFATLIPGFKMLLHWIDFSWQRRSKAQISFILA